MVSRATIGNAASARCSDCHNWRCHDRLRDRDNARGISENAAGIGDNSEEIGDDATGIVDIAAKVIKC